MNDKNMTFDT